MPRQPHASQDSRRLRRAKPAYVLTVTVVTVWFWWLVAVSQTPIAGRPVAAVEGPGNQNAPVIQSLDDSAARLAAAGQDLDLAQQAVETARKNVATAQQRWERWLTARAQRERAVQRPPTSAEPAPAPFVANPQFTELAAALQRLTAQRDELLQRLTAEHPSVLDVTARINTVNQQMTDVPELISTGPPDASQAPRSPTNPHSPVLTEDLVSTDPELVGPEGLDAAEADVRQAWDAAQQELGQRLATEQRALDQYEDLRKQIAAVVRTPRSAAAAESSASSGLVGTWPFVLGLIVLGGAELVGVRLSLALLAAENAVPLLSVGQVTSLLPVPVLAAFPSNGGSRPAQPAPGSVSGLTLWLLACEGTLAVLAFMITALTIRNVGFPADLLKHPIETMAQGTAQLAFVRAPFHAHMSAGWPAHAPRWLCRGESSS